MRGALEDTICAIATPAGEGGVGIVRLSGPKALIVAGSLVRLRSGKAFRSVASHTLHLADLILPPSPTNPGQSMRLGRASAGRILDEALVVCMRAPRSFTGEEVVEFQSHGGTLILSSLLRACIQAGARLAEPGEFTKRAFLNGRLDLSQAEAVLDTIRAKSAASLAMAQRQLRGDLGKEVANARGALLGLLAHLEAGIDFIEEDITFLHNDELSQRVCEAAGIVQRLLASAAQGRLLREGARVAILGRPNVGKSSILNRLLKEDRAIVTEIPGTTRDVIEEAVDLGGITVHLLDTAGIRQTDDVVEREGIRRSRAAQEDSDLQLIVIDGNEAFTADDFSLLKDAAKAKHVIVVNKADLPLQVDLAAFEGRVRTVTVSAKTGSGVEALKEEIRSQLVGPGAEATDSVMVTNVRHQAALIRAAESLHQAAGAIASGMAAEFVAIDIRGAADALGEITGEISTDEILERIFSEFCIGK